MWSSARSPSRCRWGREVHAGVADGGRDPRQRPGVVLDLDDEVDRHASLGGQPIVRAVIKLVFVIRRREDLPTAEFRRYWLEDHGPLARRLLESLGARRYVQTHTLDSDLNAALAASRGTAEAYDGLAEVWWDSLDALVAASVSEEGRRATRR